MGIATREGRLITNAGLWYAHSSRFRHFICLVVDVARRLEEKLIYTLAEDLYEYGGSTPALIPGPEAEILNKQNLESTIQNTSSRVAFGT